VKINAVKECIKCGKVKPLEAFYRSKWGDGRRNDCKACQEEIRRERKGSTPRRKLPPEMRYCKRCDTVQPITEFYRDSWKKDAQHGRSFTCRTCKRAKRKAAYWDDPDAARQRTRESYRRNADKHRAYGNQYRRDHLEDFARREAERRARQAGACVEHVDRLVLLEMDDGVCGICGEDVDPLAFEVDHIVPLSRGGEHSYANTQVAHRRCNNEKRARLMDELPLAA
jgi:5-methylcytosine-specific restriction endonuclease McrA